MAGEVQRDHVEASRGQLRPEPVEGSRVVEAAVCPAEDAARPPSRLPFYFLNGTSSYGSNTSDIRCLGRQIREELASLSEQHVPGHQRLYRPVTARQCRWCSEKLRRPMQTEKNSERQKLRIRTCEMDRWMPRLADVSWSAACVYRGCGWC